MYDTHIRHWRWWLGIHEPWQLLNRDLWEHICADSDDLRKRAYIPLSREFLPPSMEAHLV